MAYNATTGKIAAPVSIYDIQQALANSQNDLGRLITTGNINMWAKYKPVVRRNLLNTLPQLNANNTWKTSADIEAGGHQNESWWKADDTNHGITVPFQNPAWTPAGFVTALNNLAALIDGEKNGWTYTPPSGTINAPFRQIDFNQYNHKAPNPIKTSSGTDAVYAASQQEWTYSYGLMEVMPEAYDNRDYIVPTDLHIDGTIWQNLYIGLAIYKKTIVDGVATYSAMAWTVGNQWNGSGIINSDQQDGVDTSGSYNAIARFKDGATYYALPLYFTHNDLGQQYAGQSFVGETAGCKIIPVPYTNFMAFDAVQRATIQNIGKPALSNHQITRLYNFSTDLYLDSRVDGYAGGTAATVRLAIVNELWNGTPASGNYVYDNMWTNVVVAANEYHLVGSTGQLTVDGTHQWRALVWVNGQEYPINLIQPAPLTPV